MIRAGVLSARARLLSGSAILYLPLVFEKDSVVVLVGALSIRFPRRGIYRIDVPLEGIASLRVYRGKAVVRAADCILKIPKRKSLVLDENVCQANTLTFDRSPRDALDDWNQRRAQALPKPKPIRRKSPIPEVSACRGGYDKCSPL
jgi:hypothetical protein